MERKSFFFIVSEISFIAQLHDGSNPYELNLAFLPFVLGSGQHSFALDSFLLIECMIEYFEKRYKTRITLSSEVERSKSIYMFHDLKEKKFLYFFHRFPGDLTKQHRSLAIVFVHQLNRAAQK